MDIFSHGHDLYKVLEEKKKMNFYSFQQMTDEE